jgi:PncC family amidohydrolase
MQDIIEKVVKLGQQLQGRGWTLGTAESCTGGLVAHYITNLSGSSAFFLGGLVSYANQVKCDLLGVPEAMLLAHGAVSEQVALAMAQGIRRLMGVDVGVSVTGIAGPLGGTETKPVGTVYIAVASPAGQRVMHRQWGIDRLGNKDLSARAALDLALEHLAG